MTKLIKIEIFATTGLQERVIAFFAYYNFILSEKKENFLKFKKNNALIDAWKANPLDWGSDISILFFDNFVLAKFVVDTDTQMKTEEEKMVWLTFIESFQSCVSEGKANHSITNLKITKNKKRRFYYWAWMLTGGLVGGFLALSYSKFTGTSLVATLPFIAMIATATLDWRIKTTKMKDDASFWS
jgi:hypothetical protein